MRFPITIKIVQPGDARGWIGFGCWVNVILVLGMIVTKPSLLENDAFLILATALVITGWVQGPVGWAYQATKGGGELADKNAEIIKERAAVDATKQAEVQDVLVVNPAANPAIVQEAAGKKK